MPVLPAFSAIIFDLDGLVLDTEPTYFLAWQQAAEIMGYDFAPIVVSALSGLHYHDVVEVLTKQFGADFDLVRFNQLSSQCWRQFVQQHGIAKKAGFDELLMLLRELNIPFALATNSAESNARECLAYAGLEQVFAMIIGRDQVQHGKPAPDLFLLAAQQLQQPIEQCLVLEDSLSGIQAAQAAQAIAVLIPSQNNPEAIAYSDLLLADLQQLTQLIQSNAHKQLKLGQGGADLSHSKQSAKPINNKPPLPNK